MAAKDLTIQVKMTVEDMGRISLALDAFASTCIGERPAYAVLARKWDRLYRGTHGALSAGLVSIVGEAK